MAGGLWFYGKIDDVMPFPIGSNDTSGSGDDGASPTGFVRKVGDGAGVAPVHEPTPILLTHVNFPAGCYALEITASAGNGYANGEKYLVYTSLAVDAQNPTGALGGFELSADGGVALRGTDGDNLKDLSDQIDNTAAPGDLMGLADDAITPAKYNDVAAYIPYAGGIWIDSGAANTNTVVGVDGLPSNPVSTFAAARTLADAIGTKKYYIVNDSTLTLAATHLNWEFIGVGLRNQIDLGSQNVGDSFFQHIVISGTQGGTQKIEAECCYLNGITNLKIVACRCWLTATNTLATGTLHMIDHCSSNVPGGSTPGLTFQAGVTSIGIRHYSGGLQLNNMTSDHTISYESDGQLVIDASCVSGNVVARGNMKITDNGTTTNLTDEAVYNKTNINEQVDDVISIDANVELASIPTTTGTLRQQIQYLFTYFRNKKTITSTTETLFKEDASTPLGTATLADNGTTFTKGEMN